MIPAESELRTMGDYVITRSSDGGVYLAHADAGYRPKTERPGHKYLLRIANDLGTRYLYTKEQVQAYYNEQKNKIKDAISAKESVQTAKPQSTVTSGKAPTANTSYGNLASKSRTRNVTGKADPIQKTESARPIMSAIVSAQKRLEGDSRTRNVTGKAGPISKGESISSVTAASKELNNASAQNRLANSSRKRNVTGQAAPIQKGESITKAEMDAILEKEKPLAEKAGEAYQGYVNAVWQYGKDSEEAKQAQEQYNQYAKEIGELEDLWHKLREKNIKINEMLQAGSVKNIER